MPENPRTIRLEGIVEEALPGLTFRVVLPAGGQGSPPNGRAGASGGKENHKTVLAHLGGKMKLHRIRVIPGDTVVVEMSPYDTTRGRIVRRL